MYRGVRTPMQIFSVSDFRSGARWGVGKIGERWYVSSKGAPGRCEVARSKRGPAISGGGSAGLDGTWLEQSQLV